jgi:integrase
VFPVEKREIIYFIYHFGIPLKQFSGIKVEDVNFEDKKIKIKPTKFCKRNNAVLEKDVAKKLKKYLEKNKIYSGRIFKNDLSMYTKWIKNYGKIAGIPKRLNHSVVSNSKFSEERYSPC